MGADAGSGTPQPPLASLPDDHGSKSAELVDETIAGFDVGAEFGFAVGADRLKAELMLVVAAAFDDITGDDTFVGGGTGGGAGDGAAKPENSSLAKKSFDAIGTAGFGAVNADGCAKAKSRPFNEELFLGAGGCCCGIGFGGALSKKLPPLKGGGEVTCGADGVALGDKALALLKFEKADCAGCGGDFGVAVVGKLRPAKASVMPPKGSF